MGIAGAILGDIAGSRFEYATCAPNGIRKRHAYKLFTDANYITDDTVMSIACMDACHNGYDFARYYREYGLKFPEAGYGSGFRNWLNDGTAGPYNSFGNGSAMRCSYIGQYEPMERIEMIARESAECTHNHPEGIKGAVTLAKCVRMAEDGASKDDILKYGYSQYPRFGYDFSCEIPTDEYKDTITYQISCQGCVPVAIRCFYETSSIEDCLYLINSMEVDTDTVGAIAGAICDSFYGMSDTHRKILWIYLDTEENRCLYDKLCECGVV